MGQLPSIWDEEDQKVDMKTAFMSAGIIFYDIKVVDSWYYMLVETYGTLQNSKWILVMKF